MELSLATRLKIALVLTLGIVVIGLLPWPLVAPPDPSATITLLQAPINLLDIVILILLSLLVGFVTYFLSWPYGRQIAILAVPAGLSVWAIRTASMTDLLRVNPTFPQRQLVYAALKWDGFLWLAIVAAGFFGMSLAGRILPSRVDVADIDRKPISTANKYLNTLIAFFGSALIAQICIGAFAQNVQVPDQKLGSVVGQPAVGQIAFAVLASFGIAGFAVKKWLSTDYIWPALSTALLSFFAMSAAGSTVLQEYMAQIWPVAFFSRAVYAVLPIQLISFGVIGSVVGYWLAVRYYHWRKHTGK